MKLKFVLYLFQCPKMGKTVFDAYKGKILCFSFSSVLLLNKLKNKYCFSCLSQYLRKFQGWEFSLFALSLFSLLLFALLLFALLLFAITLFFLRSSLFHSSLFCSSLFHCALFCSKLLILQSKCEQFALITL